MSVKAIIFDSDGMLTHGARFSDTYAKEHGISIDVMTPFFTGPFNNCLIGKADLKDELNKGWLEKWGWKGTVDDLIRYWFGTGNNLDSKVFETVVEVVGKGVPCVLATNQEKYRTEYLNKEFSYDQVFNKIFSSAYVGAKKPNVEFFEEILKYFKEISSDIKKEEIVFWDDDVENVSGAKEFGFNSIQYKDFNSYKSIMQKLGLL